MINKIKDYFIDSEFRFTIFKDKINIVNYTSIGHFDAYKIVVRHNDGTIFIKGSGLAVKRLLSNEILITGEFKDIQIGDK